MDWSALGGAGIEILKFLLPFLSTIVVLVLSALAKKHIEKLGLDRSDRIDDMIDRYVPLAVNAAQRVAEKKLLGKELDKKDKLALATSTVLGELEQSGLKGVGEELIKARIENWLEVKKASPEGNA